MKKIFSILILFKYISKGGKKYYRNENEATYLVVKGIKNNVRFGFDPHLLTLTQKLC